MIATIINNRRGQLWVIYCHIGNESNEVTAMFS